MGQFDRREFFAILTSLTLVFCSGSSRAEFVYSVGKDYVGIASKADSDWKFLTCDGTLLDLTDGAKLTFHPDVKCAKKPPGWVPVPLPTGCPSSPANPNSSIISLLDSWKALSKGSKPITSFSITGANLGPIYYGNVTAETFSFNDANCTPKPKDPKGCPNCIDKVKALLAKQSNWQQEFYSGKSSIDDKLWDDIVTKDSVILNKAEISSFVDLYLRQELTKIYLDSIVTNPHN